MSQRKIIHVDMDCFYAAVEEKHNPKLKGKAVGIGGPPNTRSVLCTANYEARKFGVRAAMPSSKAVRLCPHLVLIPPHFDLYKAESKKVRTILERFTDQIEPLSLDEAYLDVTESAHCSGSATLIAKEIRRQIFLELNLTASAGVAPNKFLAKVASDWKKPNGQFVIRPEEALSFVTPLPVSKIFGVGKVTAEKMHQMGLNTCADVQKLALLELQQRFGPSRARDLYHLSRGEDDREVSTNSERKSWTSEETFNEDVMTLTEAKMALREIYQDWRQRFEASASAAELLPRIRGSVVKLRYTDFKITTCEHSLKQFPEFKDFEKLLEQAWARREFPIRLLGLGVRLGSSENETGLGSQKDDNQLAFW
jgi:DNA polymerase-4